jgi:hypothetical protein
VIGDPLGTSAVVCHLMEPGASDLQ